MDRGGEDSLKPMNEGEPSQPVGGDDEYSDEEDEYDEATEQQIREIGNHPLMDRVQKALLKQLATEDNRLTLEVREHREMVKVVTKKREQTGVELYNVQQQLAKLQMQLEGIIKSHGEAEQARIDAEALAIQRREELAKSSKLLSEEKARLGKHQSELDGINGTLRHVEKYNQEMKDEIAVARRATYKAEEQVTELEKRKQYQDLYIDNLNEQMKTISEQVALHKAQFQSQKKETNTAKGTMSEALVEMEAIAFEKKQLMQQWKTSLIGIQRRDEALQATNQALRKQEEAAIAIAAETAGVRLSVKQSQLKNEQLTEGKQKIMSEIVYLEKEVAKMSIEHAKLEERHQMLRKSLEQTDLETKRVNVQKKNLVDQCEILDQNCKVVEQERQVLEKGISDNKNTQTTVSKAAQNLHKMAGKVQQNTHAVEQDRAKMENEMSRIEVDKLNTAAHNKQLQTDLDKLVSSLKEKDKMIEKYELEIRQRNDEVEKKMYVVDRLNRKYEQLTANMTDDNHGPLEATINSLMKNIDQKKQENIQEQREWLKMQTKLVGIVDEVEKLNESLHRDTSKLTIHEQRRLRLDRSIAGASKEVTGLKKEIEAMHGEMTRLNRLIATNKELQSRLASTTFNMEKEFVAELKEMEGDSLKREHKHAKLKQDHGMIVEEILEAERQVMLWEKKIQLEKETQEALDPEVGMAEARGMEKEIHRMKLRYATLQREQERMIKEMEMAINKREAIAVRNRGRKKTGFTKTSMKRRVHHLAKVYRETVQNTQKCAGMLEKKRLQIAQIQEDLQAEETEQQKQDQQVQQLQQEINDALYTKQKLSDTTSMYQRMKRQYAILRSSNSPREPELDALMDVDKERLGILRVIDHLQVEFPQFKEVLTRVKALTDVQLHI